MRIIAPALMSLAVLAATMPVPAGQAECPRQPIGVPPSTLGALQPAVMPLDDQPATQKGNAAGPRRLHAVTHGMQAPSRYRHALVTPTPWQMPARPPNVLIDVLMAYTKRGASNYSDIRRELIEPAVEGANESFALSGLDHIRLRLVHSYQTDYLEKGMHFDHVWRFADKGDGYMEEVHDLRELYRADLAILIVDDSKGCGLATRVYADAEEAFAVVHHQCVATSHTLAHEIGHLIGASHDLAYINGTKWRDIMGSKESCGGCPRIPYWSNPRVRYRGEPTGTAAHDNARVILDHAGRVSRFR